MPSKRFKIVHRIPNSNILVDYWKTASQDKYYRFMTYLRIGADESIKDICESTYTIYTSLFNKWYLITYYQISEHRIVELRENETLVVLDEQSNPAFSVTAFDANYYTGSLMFLFQGSFGNILYTGFFRPSSYDSIFEAPVLKSLVEKREIDVAFIDNTYAAEHCEFPSRSQIIDQIVTCLRQHPKHKIAISGKRLGKEEILLDIAKALNEKIHVSEDKFIILSRLNLQNHFTTDRKKSRIYACDYIINPKECMKLQAQEGPYIIILLTAYYECNRMSNNEDFEVRGLPGLYIFPYSSHCSHSELVRFISFLKPRDVQPIIKFMTDEHSVIPQRIYNLCSKNTSLMKSQTQTSSTSPNSCSCKSPSKFYTCETGNSQKFYTCQLHSSQSSSSTMITVYDAAQKQELIDNAINELKSFNDVDDFLENVNNINNVRNFGQDVNESMMAISTIEVSGNLHESLLNTLLSNSDDSNDRIFYANATPSTSGTHHTTIIQSTNSPSPVLIPDSVGPSDSRSIVTNIQTNIPALETSPKPNSKSFFKTFDNVISTSCTCANNDNVGSSTRIYDLSQDKVHSTNMYVGNDIAENVISSTNNDSLPEIIPPPVHEPVDKNQSSASVTVGDVNIDIRSDLDLQDMSDKDAESETSSIVPEIRIEEQPPKEPTIVERYVDKFVQTDLTLATIAQLEKSKNPVTPRNEAEPLRNPNEAVPLIIQNQAPLLIQNEAIPLIRNEVPLPYNFNPLIAKYSLKNRGATIEMNQYPEGSGHKRGLEVCAASSYQDDHAKKRKLYTKTLYDSAMAMKTHDRNFSNIGSCNHLIGYNMVHPTYRSQFNS